MRPEPRENHAEVAGTQVLGGHLGEDVAEVRGEGQVTSLI
jgi:hypothetical protein